MGDPGLFDIDTGRSAIISPCGLYRYALRRDWSDAPAVAFCMLNPSIADASIDDPTIRKCIGFARRWGHGGIVVVNLFAWRSTASKGIGSRPEHVGPENDRHILAAASDADRVVFAWGAQPGIAGRVRAVTKLLCGAGVMPYRIGAPTKDGHPCHPLMLAYSRTLEPAVDPMDAAVDAALANPDDKAAIDRLIGLAWRATAEPKGAPDA